MKKITVLLLVLMLISSLSLTVFASPNPIDVIDSIGDEILGEQSDHPDAEEGATPQADEGQKKEENYRSRRNPPAETPTGELSTEPATENTDETQLTSPSETIPEDDAGAESSNRIVIVIVVASGALLLLLILALIIILVRKNAAAVAGGTTVQIEVLSGLCYNASFEFNFRRGLTIGTDKDCDLVFEDPKMLPMHAVISRAAGGRITLGECAQTHNTYIGGMKIFAPNRLRSGDIVTIADTSFRVFFDEQN